MGMEKKVFNRPGLHSDSSDKDVAAIGLVNTILATNGGVASGLNHHDTWPNTDGLLELKTVSGEPDGLLTAQVKPITIGKKLISHTFDDDKFLCYCKDERGLPVIFIGVDLENKKAYWREMSPDYVNALKSLTIHIPPENIIDYGNTNYLIPWKTICDRRKKALIVSGRGFDSSATDEVNPQKSAIIQLFEVPSQSELLKKNIDAVNSIVENIKEKILLYEGHLFLVSPTYINNLEIRETIRKNLNITLQQEELFITELTEKKILSKTGDVVVFTEDGLGKEKLMYLAQKNLINIEKIYDSFQDFKVRKAILKKIVGIIDVKQVDNFFKVLIGSFSNGFNKFTNNDDIIVNLELLDEYSFRVPKEAIKLVKKIVSSNPLPVKTYKGKFGAFPGAKHEKVLVQALDVLDSIRYLEIESVFELAVLLSKHKDKDVRKKALELIKHISEYNIFALRKIGYYPQKKVLSFIQKWGIDELNENYSIVLEIGNEILNSEFEGSQMTDYKTFTLSFGPLKASEELQSIRNAFADIIKFLYLKNDDSQIRKRLLDILEVGTRTPNRGVYSDELEKMILSYVNSLVEFYLKILSNKNLVLIHEIEEQLYWFIRRFGKEKVKDIKVLQGQLLANRLYQIFRVFYGYDLNFDEELQWREARTKRIGIIDKYIFEITEVNYSDWEKDILTVASNYSDENHDKFQYFNTFLNKLATQKPSIAIRLLSKAEQLHNFLLQLALGLWESTLHDDIRKIFLSWVKKGKELAMIGNLFWYTKKTDLELISLTTESAMRKQDIWALTTLVRGLVASYQGNIEIKKIFLTVISELTKLNSVRWLFNFYPPESTLISSLNDKESDVLLGNLLLVEDVNHDAEEILVSVAKNFPLKVTKYFAERIAKQLKKKKDSRYDAIPYSFYELPQILSKNPDVVLDEVFTWFGRKKWLYRYDSSYFLKAIFPTMNEPLRNKLLSLIKEGGNKNADTVLSILRTYEGKTFLYPVFKAFIKKFLRSESNKFYKEYRAELFIALSTTGVVSGEYGLPNAYKQKKEEIQSWKLDKSKLIQRFIKEYEEYLDRDIAYHTKRADEDIELMKRGD